MNYIQVSFKSSHLADYQQDILIAALADIGFDTFEETTTGFDGFVIDDQFDEAAVEQVLVAQDLDCAYEVKAIAPQNWNEEWEKNFSPLIISDNCYVRATFHEPQPQYEYEIVIDPKMAFGTGHHQTTTMMMQYILETDYTGKTVLDMGAGTAILGILASKRGAAAIVAIDYDEICYLSAIENAKLNNVENLTSLHGSKEVIPEQTFDIILANINRNILLDQIHRYAEVLKNGGEIFFSGFYETPDLEIIKSHCEQFGLTYINHKKIKDWVAAKFVKA